MDHDGAQRGANAAGELQGRGEAGGRQEHQELVPADPGDVVAAPERVREGAADPLQQPVAPLPAIAVVDPLEVVQVDEQEVALDPAAARRRLHLGHRRLDAPAVEQAGEGVDGGEPLELLERAEEAGVSTPARDRVDQRAVQLAAGAVGGEHVVGAQGDGGGDPVGGQRVEQLYDRGEPKPLGAQLADVEFADHEAVEGVGGEPVAGGVLIPGAGHGVVQASARGDLWTDDQDFHACTIVRAMRRSANTLLLSFVVASSGCQPTVAGEFPEPDAWGPLAGPGGPATSFEPGDLWEGCAFLDGGVDDEDHHNFVTMLDGYLLMPWVPEWSGGGLSFFAFDDPCAPSTVGEGSDGDLRESHNTGFARIDGRTYGVFDYHGGYDEDAGEIVGGCMFWDLTDPTAPTPVSSLALPGYVYPDAYARVSLSVFWQGPWVFVSGADNGLWVVDASDPEAPQLVATHTIEPPLRVGAVHVIGDLAMVSAAEGSRTVLLDVSDPTDPQPIPGGDFHVTDDGGEPREYYFANTGGRYGLFARKEAGGGFVAYDLSDARAPSRVGGFHTPDGNGGYVFRQNDHVFVGDSNFAGVFDFADPSAPLQLGRADLVGDLDTATPIGNVVVLAVDDDAVPDQASSVVPWSTEPDATPPTVELHRPADGETFVDPGDRIGLSFDEMVDFASVFEGSVRVATAAGEPVPGRFTGQENVVSFAPAEPWEDDATYVVTVPAGGVIDLSGNPTSRELSFRFSTGAQVEVP